ncbi:MAG: rhamnogalacturonan acetylesterase [Prevotella sp.]|nr:rhamnogalacturonan acetylesterase [Prevotella sp.]
MRTFKSITLGLLGLLIAQVATAVTVHTIGDSTMCDYDESTTDKRGWGMMFQQFFDSTVSINNRGKSGASSKSFYQETAYWASVKKQISSGDYVIIQFSHNDEKNDGMDGDSVIAKTGDTSVDYRGTIPYSTYKDFLRSYVTETRELGANPILVAPMCRKYFTSGTIRRSGRHDLGDSFSILNDDGTIKTGQSIPSDDRTMDYPYAMQQVAEEMGVPFIDLTTLSADLFIEYGEAACTELLFCANDNTHPNALGAMMIARLVAQAMYEQGILSDHILQNADLLVNPTSLDFGGIYTNQAVVKEVSVSGFDLSPATGTLTVSLTGGFLVSTDKQNYSESLELEYTDGSLTYTTLYVQAYTTESGEISGVMTFTNGNNTSEIPVSCIGVNLSGGEEVLLNWELSNDDSYVLTGKAEVIGESWSGLEVDGYRAPNSSAVWPDDSGIESTQLTQRNTIIGGSWPGGEVDEVSTRYIQFGIKASEETLLHIDSIGVYVCGAGGSGMRCRISYSLNEDFGDAKAIAEFASSMVSNQVYEVSSQPVIEVEEGQTMYLRFYPWYTTAATGKYFCLYNLTIHGIVEPVSASIGSIGVKDKNLVKEVYYDLYGIQRDVKPETGVYIIKQIYDDGSSLTRKVAK